MQIESTPPLEKAVWVVAEHDSRGVMPCTLETLTTGREIADSLHSSLGAILLGQAIGEHLTPALSEYGVDHICLLEHPLLENYNTDGYVAALAALIQSFQPSLLLLSATPNGRDLGPRLAARLNANVVTNCVSIKLNKQSELQFIKPTHQEKVYSTITCLPESLTLATLLPDVIDIASPRQGATPQVTRWEPSIPPEAVSVMHIETIPGDPSQIDIQEAEKLVVGGQGIENKQNWTLIEELAECLSASVGGTRIAADIGLCAKQRMIGQTGKRVKPLLYFAIGVSGSIYHMKGVEAKNIIAINSDPNAPILDHCQLGFVGDLQEILPVLLDKLRHSETG
jgi:electron transfer flavoprotein alpha subunit